MLAYLTGRNGDPARSRGDPRDLSGLERRSGLDLMKPILDEAFTFVTNNAKDFRRLYAREDIHAGLLILIPSAPPAPAMGNVAPVPAKHRCAAEPRRRCSARPEHRS